MIEQLVDGGVPIKHCNIGNMHKSEGKHILYEVHVYVDDQDEACLKRLKEKGVDVYIQITPNDRKYRVQNIVLMVFWTFTKSFETVKNILHIVDYVMIMTVNPGVAGQSYLEYIDEKIEEFIQNRKKYHYEIVVDGGISEEKIKKLNQKGVKGFILGTSSLFGKGDYVHTIKKLRVL